MTPIPEWPTEPQPAVPRQEEPETPPSEPPARRGGARSLLTGTGWQALSQILPLIVNLALTPYVIHGLGLGLYGIFLLVASLQIFLGSFDGGIGASAGRYFSIYAGRGDAVATTRLLCTLQVAVTGVSLALFAIVFWAAPAIVAFFPATDPDPAGAVLLLRVMVGISAVAQMRGLLAQVLYAHQRFAVSSTALLLGSVVYTIGVIWTVETGQGLTGIAWTFIGQQVVGSLIIVPSALRLLSRAGVGFVSKDLLKEFFQYAWKIQISGLLTMVSEQGDHMLVGKFAARDMVAFGTGASFANTLGTVPMNAAFPIQSHVGQTVGAEGPEGAADNIDRLERIWLTVIVGWIAVGAPAALFGVNSWLSLGTTLPGIIACLALISRGAHLFVFVHTQWANTLGRSDVAMKSSVVNVVVNISLSLALIGTFGALGSVVATLVASVVSGILTVILAQRVLSTRLVNPIAKVPWLIAAASAGLSFALAWTVDRFIVGPIVPEGPLGLVSIGLSAAPVLALYVVAALGPQRSRELLARIKNRG
ncbi:polysaccharide biosynthesis C-terminal domain-containing protein [Granulicoccus sp. GXG6511]|uniref:oligosaccharide flippase family protein n=1 Tax=Granulicoccus sp. GXG6511 TaxID=3381351 RepID=UPI003D7DECFB